MSCTGRDRPNIIIKLAGANGNWIQGDGIYWDVEDGYVEWY